jgi:hypothetical protein
MTTEARIPAGAEARRYVVRRVVPWPGPVRAYVLEPGGIERPLVHLMRHSPDGFDYGYGGSAPADLARSILVDFFVLRDAPDLLPVSYQWFKWQFVASADSGRPGAGLRAWQAPPRSAGSRPVGCGPFGVLLVRGSVPLPGEV